uniref:Uncharacterized protein n=1 Tax=Romanomermis culicivorax TaxID=13658 RepID=A0A915HHV6_ROMCU
MQVHRRVDRTAGSDGVVVPVARAAVVAEPEMENSEYLPQGQFKDVLHAIFPNRNLTKNKVQYTIELLLSRSIHWYTQNVGARTIKLVSSRSIDRLVFCTYLDAKCSRQDQTKNLYLFWVDTAVHLSIIMASSSDLLGVYCLSLIMRRFFNKKYDICKNQEKERFDDKKPGFN